MVDVTIDEDAADPIEIGNKPKFGKRMDAAIMRNMLHHKMMAEEVETLEMAKKRAATDMKERMTNFALKQHKNGISTGTEKIDVQKARQRLKERVSDVNHKFSLLHDSFLHDYYDHNKHSTPRTLPIRSQSRDEDSFTQSVLNNLPSFLDASKPTQDKELDSVISKETRQSLGEQLSQGNIPRSSASSFSLELSGTEDNREFSESDCEFSFVDNYKAKLHFDKFGNLDNFSSTQQPPANSVRSLTSMKSTEDEKNLLAPVDLKRRASHYSWNLSKGEQQILSSTDNIGQPAQQPEPMGKILQKQYTKLELPKNIRPELHRPSFRVRNEMNKKALDLTSIPSDQEPFDFENRWSAALQKLGKISLSTAPTVNKDMKRPYVNGELYAHQKGHFYQHGCFITILSREPPSEDCK
eukprot:Seg1955.6 transcript_id=Seg1955.6/GoldUCD/mRNA.D3Y31 product="hypothetical protein" protein_id=Seg1955.6/GoldUCD/D3Y31